jgi:hypothetical protein
MSPAGGSRTPRSLASGTRNGENPLKSSRAECEVTAFDGLRSGGEGGACLIRLRGGGQRLELPFTLEVGPIAETINVLAGSPVVDTSSTTTGGVLDSDQLARLPVPRRLAETLYMVPGVSSSSGAG